MLQIYSLPPARIKNKIDQKINLQDMVPGLSSWFLIFGVYLFWQLYMQEIKNVWTVLKVFLYEGAFML